MTTLSVFLCNVADFDDGSIVEACAQDAEVNSTDALRNDVGGLGSDITYQTRVSGTTLRVSRTVFAASLMRVQSRAPSHWCFVFQLF